MRDCCMYARHPVESQYSMKLDRSGLAADSSITYRVTNNADGVASRQASQTDTEAASQVHEAVNRLYWPSQARLHVSGDKDCDHQGHTQQ